MFKFFVTEEIEKKRYSICETCESFNKDKAQCKECHCFMKYKVKMALSECPKGKWRKEECLLS